MSDNILLLEDGTDSTLDESGYPLLLEIPSYSGSISGYLDQRISSYFLLLEDEDYTLQEDEDSFLMVEYDDENIINRSSNLRISAFGELGNYFATGIPAFSNMTCLSLAQFDTSPFGYLDSSNPTTPLISLTTTCLQTNMGSLGVMIGPMISESILGIFNENFGFLRNSGRLNSIHTSSTGIMVGPNYGYFSNYIY